MIIGLTGPAGAGKTEAVKYLLDRGFKQVTLSDFVIEETAQRGLPIERANLQTVGNDMRQQQGPGVMGKLAREYIETNNPTNHWIIDGIRNPAEIDELSQLPDYRTIAIVASMPILVDRLLARQDQKDQGTREELEQKIKRELSGNEPAHGLRIDLCIEAADIVIENEGTLNDLHDHLETAIS